VRIHHGIRKMELRQETRTPDCITLVKHTSRKFRAECQPTFHRPAIRGVAIEEKRPHDAQGMNNTKPRESPQYLPHAPIIRHTTEDNYVRKYIKAEQTDLD